jgi:site-specific DNA-methyltransferase (adenine-specific)
MEKQEPKSIAINADNMEVMESYPSKYFDLAIVDPPYGASDALEKDKDNSKKHSAKRTSYHQFENIVPTKEYFSELKRVSKNQIVWGGNFFGLKGGVIAWNKNGTAFGEGEVAICTTHKSVRFFEYTWNGMLQQNMKNKETRIHPTQKPIALYEWILRKYAKEGDKILDTNLGSGSSRIACHKLGFDFVGIELDKYYFEAQEKRFKEYSCQMNLF